MCRAFSCLVTCSGHVYWKRGMDSHDAIWELFKDQDPELADTDEFVRHFVRVEETPDEGYLSVTSPWTQRIDEIEPPFWWSAEHTAAVTHARKQWQREVYALILEEARHPVNPLSIPRRDDVSELEIAWLQEWAKRWGNDRDGSISAYLYLEGCIGESIWDEVCSKVWNEVESSAWADVWCDQEGDIFHNTISSIADALHAYVSSLFDVWPKGHPLASVVNLWRVGLVPAFDGKVWRLHAGLDGRVVYEKDFVEEGS